MQEEENEGGEGVWREREMKDKKEYNDRENERRGRKKLEGNERNPERCR